MPDTTTPENVAAVPDTPQPEDTISPENVVAKPTTPPPEDRPEAESEPELADGSTQRTVTCKDQNGLTLDFPFDTETTARQVVEKFIQKSGNSGPSDPEAFVVLKHGTRIQLETLLWKVCTKTNTDLDLMVHQTAG